MIQFPRFTFSWQDALRRFFGASRHVAFITGKFTYTVTRGGVIIAKGKSHNASTTVGNNYALNTSFDAGTRLDNWYLGLIDNASFTALAAADTMASHAGWIELTAYDEATRVEWAPSAASGSVIVSTAKTFTMNASKTIKGMFLNSVSTKSGTTGTLWATGLLDATQAVVATDTFALTYELELQSVA